MLSDFARRTEDVTTDSSDVASDEEADDDVEYLDDAGAVATVSW